MLFNAIFATDVLEVGVSWFDFYSIGHLCLGIGLFLFFSLFYTIPKKHGKVPIFSLLLVFILTVILAVVWEIIENIVFLNLGWKFENRPDILIRSTFLAYFINDFFVVWLAYY